MANKEKKLKKKCCGKGEKKGKFCKKCPCQNEKTCLDITTKPKKKNK